VSDDAVSAFAGLGTTTISDALDRLGIAGQAHGIVPLDRSFRLCGRAFTIRYGTAGSTPGDVGDYVDDVEPGAVIVIDNGGRLDATVWGDLLTIVAHRRGLGGTVIHGVCRDTPRSLQLGYPLFTRGAYMRTGKDRVQVEAYEESVTLGEVLVEPGDIVVGDADGVVSVPRAREDDVLAAAAEIAAAEDRIRAAVEAGERLDEARKREGYHRLQSRR
jgi:4-hydroxy-4-methyl-2-oxoglutarate aldolase